MFRDEETYAPFLLAETSRGKYSLLLFDSKMMAAEPAFSAAGRDPGGYAWSDIASQVVKTRQPDIAGRFDLDPEAGMFTAYGTDLEALKVLGAHLCKLFHDHAALTEVAKAAPYEYD